MTGFEHLVGVVLDDKYRIDKQLGVGGMGAVFRAKHLGTGRPVALKVIVPQLVSNEEFLERFKREAKAAGRLRHPNVVDVTDFGFARSEDGQIAYLVMEFLDGCSLADVLAEESRLPLDWVVDIFDQVCSAISEAHAQGVIHRDLKPANIWLEPNRRGGYTVKVLDFGLAKLRGPGEDDEDDEPAAPAGEPAHVGSPETTALRTSWKTGKLPAGATTQVAGEADTGGDPDATEPAGLALTRVGTVMGTPTYMSPEQCRGDDLGPGSDIYSLGVLAYELLAGETPFTGPPMTLVQHHVNTLPPHIGEKRPDLPSAVADLIMSTLEKEPENRPESADVFASTLRASAEGPGKLLSRAFGMCSEHFPTFFKISLLASIPMILVEMIELGNDLLMRWGLASHEFTAALDSMYFVLIGLSIFFALSMSQGVSVLALAQLILAPLRPVRIHLAFDVLKRRLWSFIFGTALYFVFVIAPALVAIGALALAAGYGGYLVTGNRMLQIGEILIASSVAIAFGLLAIKQWVDYCLFPIVLLVEERGGMDGLRRSKELTARNRAAAGIVSLVAAIDLVVATFIPFALIRIFMSNADSLRAELLTTLVPIGVEVFTTPVVAVVFAMLYLKLFQASGRPIQFLLDKQYVEEEMPHTRWQARLHKRLTHGSVGSTGGHSGSDGSGEHGGPPSTGGHGRQ